MILVILKDYFQLYFKILIQSPCFAQQAIFFDG